MNIYIYIGFPISTPVDVLFAEACEIPEVKNLNSIR